jgi:uncharacterized protein YndB with AHSA1/START domain
LGTTKESDFVQPDPHSHVTEANTMPVKRARPKLEFTWRFEDRKTGELITNDPKEFFANMPIEQQSEYKARIMEIMTGKRHKAVK